MTVRSASCQISQQFFGLLANVHASTVVLLFFAALVPSEDDGASTFAGIPATVMSWLLAVALMIRKRSA